MQPDPRLVGFFRKYGGQRATDAGPTCPRCHQPIRSNDRAARLADQLLPGLLIHADCVYDIEWVNGSAVRVAVGGFGE